MLNNDIFDPELKQTYKMYGDNEDKHGWFQETEPIWVIIIIFIIIISSRRILINNLN